MMSTAPLPGPAARTDRLARVVWLGVWAILVLVALTRPAWAQDDAATLLGTWLGVQGTPELLEINPNGTIASGTLQQPRQYRGVYHLDGRVLEYSYDLGYGPRQASVRIIYLTPTLLVTQNTLTGQHFVYQPYRGQPLAQHDVGSYARLIVGSWQNQGGETLEFDGQNGFRAVDPTQTIEGIYSLSGAELTTQFNAARGIGRTVGTIVALEPDLLAIVYPDGKMGVYHRPR